MEETKAKIKEIEKKIGMKFQDLGKIIKKCPTLQHFKEENEKTLRSLNKILIEYNKYIQTANEEEKYKTGWKPVCIKEFIDNEMEENK